MDAVWMGSPGFSEGTESLVFPSPLHSLLLSSLISPTLRLHVPPTLGACHNTSPAVTSGTIFRRRPLSPWSWPRTRSSYASRPTAKTSPLPWSDPHWLHRLRYPWLVNKTTPRTLWLGLGVRGKGGLWLRRSMRKRALSGLAIKFSEEQSGALAIFSLDESG